LITPLALIFLPLIPIVKPTGALKMLLTFNLPTFMMYPLINLDPFVAMYFSLVDVPSFGKHAKNLVSVTLPVKQKKIY
jgi:hypothetical protein